MNVDDLSQYQKIKTLYDNKNPEEASPLGGIISFGKNFKFYYLRKDSAVTPIAEFRVSETFNGEGVCLQNDKGNISPGREDYLLMKDLRTECPNDDRFFNFHRIDEF